MCLQQLLQIAVSGVQNLTEDDCKLFEWLHRLLNSKENFLAVQLNA
jgi:hypothetical protein